MITLRAMLCACFLLALAAPTGAERLPIKIYTSADGLGSSASFNLVRDSRGFIWLCSRDGLVRFDGYRFITYRIGSDDADPAVYSVLPTRNGVYWINLNTGMDYRFIDKGDATSLEPIPQQLSGNDPRIPLVNVEPIKELRYPSFEDSDGNLWGYEAKGLDLLSEANGQTISQLIEINLPGNPPGGLTDVAFKPARESGFWLATKETLVRRLADGRQNYYVFDSQSDHTPVRFFAEDKDNRVWIARPQGIMVLKVEPASQMTESNNLSVHKVAIKAGKVDPDGQAQLPAEPGQAFTFTFRDIFRRSLGKQIKDETAAKPTVWGIVCASDGKTWIANTGGLVLFDGKRFQHFTEEQGLASNNVAEIVDDNEGNIWLSSYGGLMRINPRGLIAFDLRDGLAETRVNSINEDRDGGLIFVTDNWNISRFQNGQFKTVRPRLPSDAVRFWHSNAALLDSRGDWWVITSKGLYRYTGVNRIEDLNNRQPAAIYTDKNGLIANATCNVFEDSHGDLWIGPDLTSRRMGLTRWQRATNTFQHFFTKDGLPPVAYFSAFSEDKAGSLWFGFGAGGHGGLSRLRNGSFKSFGVEDGIPSGTITDLYTDSKGRLWIASHVGGLSRVDDPAAEHPVLKHYTIADGLTSNNVRCITEDLFGNIYVGTVRGVNRLSPETGQIKYYGTGDGLAGDFVSVAHRDREGAIWFGTFSGISKLVPEPDTPLPPPPTLISGLRIAGVDYSVSPLGQTELTAPEQTANRNNLQVDFFGVSTGGNADTRYQYKLEGADQNWSSPSTQRTVTFANLRPGNYRFLVRSVNAYGITGQKPASITFRILPPVWQRGWFIALAALLVAGSVLALDRYRVARARELTAALNVQQKLTTDLTEKGTALSRANRTLALDADVTQVLSEAESRGEAAPRILQLICERTGWEIGAIWRMDNQSDVLRCVAFWHPEALRVSEFEKLSRETEFPRGTGLPGRVWAKSQPIWITDLQADANFPRLESAQGAGLRSALGFPVLLEGEVLGVIEFFSREPRAYDEEQLQMVATIGSHLGQLIERKQAEEALRESETRFRTLAETASDAIITIDEDSRILFVNTEAEEIFGYAIEEMVGADLTMLMPEYLRHLHRSGFNRYLETGRKHIGWTAVELPGLHKSGREIPLELSFGEFQRNGQRYFTGIARDITERKRAEEEIRSAREERLRELERVRRRIATDLHDDIGSALTQISILSEVVHRQISDGESPIAGPLSMIANSSRELVDSMSDIVWAINPQKDHLSDLLGRMRRFAADMLTARNIEFQFHAPATDQDVQLGANIRREVFLIFKESINNLVKHSGCDRAEVLFAIDQDHLTLKISDNGKGFETNAESDGHGLISMRDRAAALGAEFAMTSNDGHGTTISLDVPLFGVR